MKKPHLNWSPGAAFKAAAAVAKNYIMCAHCPNVVANPRGRARRAVCSSCYSGGKR